MSSVKTQLGWGPEFTNRFKTESTPAIEKRVLTWYQPFRFRFSTMRVVAWRRV